MSVCWTNNLVGFGFPFFLGVLLLHVVDTGVTELDTSAFSV